MLVHIEAITFLILALTWPVMSSAPVIFHGTSVVIKPSNETSSPSNSSLIAANFFCYMVDEGYFSFGWWVTASLNGNTSHCRPDSTSFHWYEFAHKQSCDDEAGTCLYQTRNVGIRAPTHADPLPLPDRTVEYVIRPLDIGNDPYGQIAVSYIEDEDVSVYGVGTRQLLNGNLRTLDDCKQALETLRSVQHRYRPDLGFELDDPCGSLTTGAGHATLKISQIVMEL